MTGVKIKSAVVLFAAGLTMAGCSSDDNALRNEPAYNPIVLTANDACDLLSSTTPQRISDSKTYSMKEKFGYGREVEMQGNGSVDVDIQIYPFYALEGSPSSGDYYLVEAAITVHSEKMWDESQFTYEADWGNGTYKTPQQTYAFYFKQLDFECSLLDSDGNIVGEFPAGNFPTPLTTVESTTYETGFSIGISGKIKIGVKGDVVYAKGEIEPEISIINTAKRNTEVLEIQNRSDSQSPAYTFLLNSNIGPDNITPLSTALTNVTFYQSWLWRVPDTKDFSTESFKLRYKTKETYGGFSQGWDKVLHPYVIYTPKDVVAEQDEVTVDVLPPSRIPMGQLSIENREDGRVFVTDIKVFKTGTDTLAADSGDNVYAPGDEFECWLDEGDYDITFSKGSSDDDMKTYKYSKGALSVVRDQEVHIYTDYYFRQQ